MRYHLSHMPLKWPLRIVAVLSGIACLVYSIILAAQIVGTGFAIGAWIDLPGYEQALAEARQRSASAVSRLLVIQGVGGISAFVAYPRRVGFKWCAACLAGFPILTFVLFWTSMFTIAAFRTPLRP